MEKEKNNDSIFIKMVMCALVGAAIGAGGVYLSKKNELQFAEKYGFLADCDTFVTEHGLPEKELNKTAIINGFFNSYDKFTYFVEEPEGTPASDVKLVNEMLTATGCGFELDFDEENNIFFSLIEPGMTADLAGIVQGDIITAVDGNEITAKNFSAVRKIGGKGGTSVTVTVLRGEKSLDIEMTRTNGTGTHPPLCITRMIGKTLYVKPRDMFDLAGTKTIEEINSAEFDSVVFDLRGNSGGLSHNAMNIADIFIGEGVYATHDNSGLTDEYYTKNQDTDRNVPIAVLIDDTTASAAEILTALLKQYGDAVLVGTNTYGKGIYQSDSPLNEYGYVHYTAGTFTVGDWECWDGVGIAPDYEIPHGDWEDGSDADLQLKKALEILR